MEKNNNYYNKAYDNLYNILSKPETNINNQTQLNMEESLNNLCRDFNIDKQNSVKQNNLGISLDNISKDMQDLLITTSSDLKVTIKKYKSVIKKNITQKENGPKPSMEHMDAWAEGKKNVAIPKALGNKFPFLNEHSEQLSLDERVNSWTTGLQKVNKETKSESNIFETC